MRCATSIPNGMFIYWLCSVIFLLNLFNKAVGNRSMADSRYKKGLNPLLWQPTDITWLYVTDKQIRFAEKSLLETLSRINNVSIIEARWVICLYYLSRCLYLRGQMNYCQYLCCYCLHRKQILRPWSNKWKQRKHLLYTIYMISEW